MVNLRSGSTPDLTQEYVPPRRRRGDQQTPENETPEPRGPLPTPVTNRKATPGAFEPDDTIVESNEQNESNESNEEFEDPIEGINEMSGNTGGQSAGSGSVSEETRMRLEIARLQHEVERMKASRGESSVSNEELSADLANYLQRKGRTSAIVKILGEFRDQVRPIKKPIVLTGSANYPMWKEEILLAARQSETDDILNDKQISPDEDASKDMQRFWSERNIWLYNYMWSAIAPQAKSHFIIPKESQLSAYSLWSVIEDNFAERPAVRRTRLFQELIEMTSKSKGSDRAFIERLIAIRTDYIRLGYNVEDFMFFDRLLTGVSKGWSSFIKNRMDAIEKDENARTLEDDFMGLCRDILLRLPAAGEPPTFDGKTPTNNAQDSNKKDKKDKEKEKVSEDKDKNSAKPEKKGNNAAKACYHCQKVGHVQTDCWSKFPEKRPTNRGGGPAPVHNVVEQVFHTTEKAYSTGQTGKDTWVLDSGSGAHATPCKDLISIVPQKVNVILEMADGSTAPATAIGKVDIPVEGANLPLQDYEMIKQPLYPTGGGGMDVHSIQGRSGYEIQHIQIKSDNSAGKGLNFSVKVNELRQRSGAKRCKINKSNTLDPNQLDVKPVQPGVRDGEPAG
ncbi:predicted protein [Histoplasma mississippiense (nom. inval.)]|uniref:predicted protein n=1 Tax=Ajellomyces capsulatus (strain NAm1 / WU24) TaxID=2059318 RepID=UPI000157B8EE|nr:predicted protein [Histoplasma mississippiense (nom. inval.)]EDN03553.1 predicted protein [Histoplasma mississippiense (nom. inval.)]